jgi:hypothetical protein
MIIAGCNHLFHIQEVRKKAPINYIIEYNTGKHNSRIVEIDVYDYYMKDGACYYREVYCDSDTFYICNEAAISGDYIIHSK